MSQRRPFVGALIALSAIAGVSIFAELGSAEEPDSATLAYAGTAADSGTKPAAPKAAKPPRPYLDSQEGSRAVSPAAPAPRAAAPARAPDTAGARDTFIPPEAMAGSYGAAAGPATAVPNMIGDSMGAVGGFGGMKFSSSTLGIFEASLGLAGGSRPFKIAEDESPIPTDRLIFDYNHFQNPLVDINGQTHNLDRFTFGIEKTFRDGLWSLEFRVPFATDYNSTQSLVGGSLFGTEFGDMTVVLKRAVIRRENFVLAAGLGMVFPTGADWKVVDAGGTAVEVWNEAVHLEPFLGAAWSPGERLFFLFFTQLNFDTHGDTVLVRHIPGGGLDTVGIFNEQSLLFLDFSMGYRLYQNPNARWLTGIVPMIELHYTSTMQDMDSVTDIPTGTFIGPPSGSGRRDILNLTAGLHLQMGPLSTLTVAAVAPLKTGLNREFDCEVLAQYNRRF
jgi:hypothetical protein